MTGFRTLLVALFTVVVVYTLVVVANHGMGLFPIFFGDIARMAWPGQFNLDFLGFLTLSGVWVAWRHHFSLAGLALGVVAFTGGIPFLTAYLFIVSFQANGDIAEVMLGKTRAAG